MSEWQKHKSKNTIFIKVKWWLIDRYCDIRHIPSFINKVITYTKILWSDYDFDYIYLFKLMRLKLYRMRNRIDNDKFVSSNIRTKQIKYALFLLDRIIKNEYFSEEEQKLDDKWGKLIMFTKLTNDNDDMFHLKMTRDKCLTQQDELEEKNASRQLSEKQDLEYHKDIDRLFKHMNKYILKWWT